MVSASDIRELDRTIAECVGWRSEQTAHGYRWRIRDNKWGSPDNYAYDPDLVFNYLYDKEIIPHYTEDMSAAIRLVDEVQPVYFELSYSPDRMNWRAEFTPLSSKDTMHFADAREPAEAICRAWLAYINKPVTT